MKLHCSGIIHLLNTDVIFTMWLNYFQEWPLKFWSNSKEPEKFKKLWGYCDMWDGNPWSCILMNIFAVRLLALRGWRTHIYELERVSFFRGSILKCSLLTTSAGSLIYLVSLNAFIFCLCCISWYMLMGNYRYLTVSNESPLENAVYCRLSELKCSTMLYAL